MLVKCPECAGVVSDKAYDCPHCGYPLNKSKKARKYHPHKRLPNGFGQITELKNRNLRKPFRAMVTVGKNDSGRPICKLLKPEAYFETYNEAYMALLENSKNPYEPKVETTMQELFKEWFERYKNSGISASMVAAATASWNYCSSVYDLKVVDLRAFHIRACMDDGEYKGRKPSPYTIFRMRAMFTMLLDYAIEKDIITTNYAKSINISTNITREMTTVKSGHETIDLEKLRDMFKMPPSEIADAITIQVMMGWRPQELCQIEIENINTTDWTITGGMKTMAGTNRVVPIPDVCIPIVKRCLERTGTGKQYLFSSKRDLTYETYSRQFRKIFPGNRPHDARKTFVTMAKQTGLNDFAIKRIVGHAITDVTEHVYTERSVDWIRSEINKIQWYE